MEKDLLKIGKKEGNWQSIILKLEGEMKVKGNDGGLETKGNINFFGIEVMGVVG